MARSFDGYEYLSRLRARWRVIAVACAVAGILSLAVSLLLPRKYTATSRIVIEAPAGSDLRAAMAVSPIYLESLKTYELLAASDHLFLQAVQRFGLREKLGPIDKLKRSVLKVTIPHNTKVLEISATLREPEKAHALALYLAEETVKLNRSVNREGDQELTTDAEKDVAEARVRLGWAERAWMQAATREPTDPLTAELESDEDLKSAIQRQLVSAELGLAASEAGEARSARIQVESLRKQMNALERKIAGVQKLLAERAARLEKLDSERKAAQALLKTAEVHLQEVRSTVGYRGERLKIIDPGIVPERPSFPNIPLNVVAALLAGLIVSVLYLSLEFSYQLQKVESLRSSLRVAGRND